MNKKILPLIFILFLFSIQFATADGIIEPLFRSLDSLNIAENYEEYHLGIDFILYLLIFGSALNATMKKKFGQGAALGFAVALSIAMVVFEYRQGFSLGDFYLVAVLALVIIVGAYIFSHINHDGKRNWFAVAIVYIAMYIILKTRAPDIAYTLKYDYAMWNLLIDIILLVSIVYVVLQVVKFIKGNE